MANVTKGIRCKATIYVYTNKLEKPEVMLEGDWTGRDVVRAGGLLNKAYRLRIRDLQRAGKLSSEEAAKKELEVSPDAIAEEDESPEPTNEEGKE